MFFDQQSLLRLDDDNEVQTSESLAYI
jgi:hypothetical protein